MYCCEIWGNNFNSRTNPLFLLQKRAIRIVNNSHYRANTAALFYQLKTLKLYDLIKLNTLIVLFKARARALPLKLMSFFSMNTDNVHTTRQKGNFKELYCRTKIKSMCVSVKGPKIWNKMDSNLKDCYNLRKFKKSCKTSMLESYA